jgi:hypothetical protein
VTPPARLSFRLQRFELVATVVATLVVLAAAAYFLVMLRGISFPVGCFEAWLGGPVPGDVPGGPTEACTASMATFNDLNENVGGKVLAAMAILPLIAGLALGVPIVSRELEARTAAVAWSLTGRRARWFAGRTLPILAVLVVALSAAALAATVVATSRQPWLDGQPAFWDGALFGPPVVGRAIAAFGIAAFVGAVVGRTLPALLIAGLAWAVLLNGVGGAQQGWLDARKEIVADASVGAAYGWNGVIVDVRWQAPDGSLLTDGQALALAPGNADPYAWLSAQGYEMVQLGVPIERLPEWQWLELGGLAVVGLGGLVAAAVVVERRRPA